MVKRPFLAWRKQTRTIVRQRAVVNGHLGQCCGRTALSRQAVMAYFEVRNVRCIALRILFLFLLYLTLDYSLLPMYPVL
jgi:hypothetical protein